MKKYLMILLFLQTWFYASSVVANGCDIFVAKLNLSTSAEDLRYAFEEFGAVSKVDLKVDPDTGRSRGFAVVSMPDCQQAEEAILILNGTTFDGRNIAVKKAIKRL